MFPRSRAGSHDGFTAVDNSAAANGLRALADLLFSFYIMELITGRRQTLLRIIAFAHQEELWSNKNNAILDLMKFIPAHKLRVRIVRQKESDWRNGFGYYQYLAIRVLNEYTQPWDVRVNPTFTAIPWLVGFYYVPGTRLTWTHEFCGDPCTKEYPLGKIVRWVDESPEDKQKNH